MAVAEAPAPSAAPIRAIGIDRISEVGKRKANGSLHSDKTQVADIMRECERNGFELIDVVHEHNVSGGLPLDQRPFGDAIARVERGEADAIVFAYRDRSDRSIVHGSDAIERMDEAGGILIAGGSVLSHATPDSWAQATMGSFMGEWQRRVIKHKSAKGVAEAVLEDNKLPISTLPIGILRNEDGTGRLDSAAVQEIVRECFRRRANGETIAQVREYLAEMGYERSYRSVQIMLRDRARLYLGEIKHGKLHNRKPGFDAIVDRDLWDAVQKARVPSGRTAKSDRLLARQGVLLCESCDGRMVAGSQISRWNGKSTRYAFYKCGRGKDGGCPAPGTITAKPLEAMVIERVKEIYSDAKGHASQAASAREAAAEAEAARTALATAKRRALLLPEGEDDEEAMAVVRELTEAYDEARAEARRLESLSGAEVVRAAEILDDPDPEALAAKRGLIKLALASITVRPGRGSLDDRVTFEPLR